MQHYTAYQVQPDTLKLTLKKDKSPVSSTDLAIDTWVVTALEKHFPYLFISETLQSEPYEVRKHWKTCLMQQVVLYCVL